METTDVFLPWSTSLKNQWPELADKITTFAELVDLAATARPSRDHTLSDGIFSLTYRELPDRFEQLDRYFAERGVNPGSCLALECINSVPAALTLMYLFARGHDCALFPPASQAVSVVEPPRFCRFSVKIKSFLNDPSPGDLGPPETFLSLADNDSYKAPHYGTQDAGGKLFLRTSGSLGFPKMAVHPHGRLLKRAFACCERFRITAEDRITIPVPIFHMYGLGDAWIPSFAAGACIDLQENANILRYLDREREFKPTLSFLTPTFCAMFPRGGEPRRHYRAVVVGGDRMKTETFMNLERRFGRLINLYGSTEMGAIASWDPTVPDELRVFTVGRPMPQVQLRLSEVTEEKGTGEPGLGEIQCRHEDGFAGYVDHEGHVSSPVEDGWFGTGDFGRVHQGDFLEVVGRIGHSVNRDGRLVHFSEVERAMEEIDGITRVVLVRSAPSRHGDGITAYCSTSAGVGRTAAGIRQAARRRLPNFAVPDGIVILDALPVLPNGKVDRQGLQKLVQSEPEHV